MVCPTGAGKSLIAAEIVRKLLSAAPHMRILIVSHRAEIIKQNAAEITALVGIPVGIYSASLGIKRLCNVTCANIQSVYKKNLGQIDVILVDECHLINGNSGSMYQKLFRNHPRAKVCGLTATP